MSKNTFVALAGSYGIVFLLTTAWTAWQVAAHGTQDVRSPIFPALTLGALVGVVVLKVGSDRRRRTTPAIALLALASFAVVTFGVLGVWLLLSR